MDYRELEGAAFSVIKDDDPYKESKQLQMRCWCSAFLDLFDTGGRRKLPFFVDVLSHEECWVKTDTIQGMKLNRRTAARKMVEPQSWRGQSNPLDDFELYQVACWCCLEEDVVALFERFKQEDEIKDDDTAALRTLVKSLSGRYNTDSMMEYWSHVVIGYTSELKLEGRHLYAYGLDRALGMLRGRVEAVEFFWGKIKSLPEDELSAQQKDEIFMNTTVRAAGNECNSYPDVFEFCFNRISPDKYPELLKRDLDEHRYFGSFSALRGLCCFGHIQTLFDCLKPSDISEDDYRLLLECVEIEDCSVYYADEGIRLFMHMWMKEGFDNHRAFVLSKVMDKSLSLHTNVLIQLVKKHYVEPVWAVLDKASPDQIKGFMDSKQADYIRSVFKERGDKESLNTFLSYDKSVVGKLEELCDNLNVIDLNKAHSLYQGKHIVKEVCMPNEEMPHYFELIELLLREATPSASAQLKDGRDPSFTARFQSYIDQIPSDMYSEEWKGYFSHFFLGSFTSLAGTKTAEELGIKEIYFRFDSAETLKVAVIKDGQIKNDRSAIDNIKLFSISESKDKSKGQFTSGELENILKTNLILKDKKKNLSEEARAIKDRIKGRVETRSVQISKEKDGCFVKTKVKGILNSSISYNFHKIGERR